MGVVRMGYYVAKVCPNCGGSIGVFFDSEKESKNLEIISTWCPRCKNNIIAYDDNKFNHELDAEYLNRKIIPDVTYIITDANLNISSPNTSWVRAKREALLNKELMLDKYTLVYGLAKKYKMRIGRKNGYKKFITDNWERYINEYNYYSRVFDWLITYCNKIMQRGIHYGCSDDQILNIAMAWKECYNEMYHAMSVSSEMNRINEVLDIWITRLNPNYGDGYPRVSIDL